MREIANILRMPGTTEIIDLFDGELKVIGVRVPSVTPLYRQPISELSESRNLKTRRFIAVRREDKIIVPRGDTHFLMGDEVYVSIRPSDIPDFPAWAVPECSPCRKLVISAGSELGLLLAQTLEKSDMPVVLLEANAERARQCAESLKQALVPRGMSLDQEALEEAGVRSVRDDVCRGLSKRQKQHDYLHHGHQTGCKLYPGPDSQPRLHVGHYQPGRA